MKKIYYSVLSVATALLMHPLLAQDDFDMGDFQAADNTVIKSFCNNKVLNLSPTKLISIGYDFVGAHDWETEFPLVPVPNFPTERVTLNHGLRLDATVPVVSKSNIIFNLTGRYWESRYQAETSASINSSPLQLISQTGLRTATLGFLAFKPLDEKHFLIFQGEAALNGNYNFSEIDPDFGKLKYSASALYGWKFNDNTNLAIGVTRTYRGGRVLHIPILLYNKTFNEKWGIEALLPAYGGVRRNFSTKSFIKLGYELEGQSYLLQEHPEESGGLVGGGGPSSVELRKSEIRPRISWDKALTDFVWINFQAGLRVNYRLEVDADESSSDPFVENNIGLPYYFSFGINLASP